MAMTFHVLASGSSGNASLLDVNGAGILLDFGLRPRLLAQRLRACGASWSHIRSALLTHTHSDHWQAHTLAELLQRRIPLYCHAGHVPVLERAGTSFAEMAQTGLIRFYEVDQPWDLAGCRSEAFEVPHDGGITCGFRFDGPAQIFGASWGLGYVADLGCWDDALATRLTDVDVLALEFNHDVEMQRRSGRPFYLIRRVLGDNGHLSNVQAADLLRAVLARSEPGRLQHLVQLHLSQDCNRPELARAAAAQVRGSVQVHTACQDDAGPSLALQALRPPRRRVVRPPGSERRFVQARLPGWE